MDPENVVQFQYPEPAAPPAPGTIVLSTGDAVHHTPLNRNQSLPLPFIKLCCLPSEEFFCVQIRNSIGLFVFLNGVLHDFPHLRLQERREVYSFLNI